MTDPLTPPRNGSRMRAPSALVVAVLLVALLVPAVASGQRSGPGMPPAYPQVPTPHRPGVPQQPGFPQQPQQGRELVWTCTRCGQVLASGNANAPTHCPRCGPGFEPQAGGGSGRSWARLGWTLVVVVGVVGVVAAGVGVAVLSLRRRAAAERAEREGGRSGGAAAGADEWRNPSWAAPPPRPAAPPPADPAGDDYWTFTNGGPNK